MDIRSTLAAQVYGLTRAAAQPTPTERGAGEAFAATTKDFLGAMREGEATVKAGLVGRADPQAVVEALAATELAVQTAVALRDKVVEAYQEILRMPV